MSITRMRYGMRTVIRPLMLIFVAIFFLSSFFIYGGYQQDRARASEHAQLLRVNGVEVSRETFDTYLAQMAQQQRNMGFGGITFEHLLSTVAFDRALQDALKVQAAEKMGINVSEREAEEQIDKEVDEIVKMRAPTLKGEELDDFKRQVRAAAFSVEARRSALISQKLEEKIRASARPVEVQVQHILVKTDSRSQADALKKAQEIHAKAKGGQDFAQLVTQFSEDEGSKPKAGDIGWVNDKAQLVPEFKAASLKLKKGEISEPVLSQFGYHIIKATDERPYVSAEKDPKKKQEDEAGYKDRVAGAIWEGYSEGLRRHAKIEGLNPYAKGLLLEREVGPEGLPEGSPQARAKLLAAAQAFSDALASPGQEAGNGLRWHIAELYKKVGDSTAGTTDADKKSKNEAYDKAVAMLNTALGKGADKEIYMQLGEMYQKMERKTDAVQAYIKASELAYDDIAVRGQLADKFKELGRMDLSKQQAAEKRRREQQQAAEQKRMEAEQKKLAAEQKKREAEEKKKLAAEKKKAAPAAEDKSKQPAAKDGGAANP